MTVYWPNGELTRPRVSSDYDAARRNPVTGIVQPHNGIDLIGWTDNKSPVDGTVLFAGYNGAAGNEVRIRADGPTAFHVGDCYRILHNARLYVSTGQRVSARQPVGLMGTTGQSTGVHCHFETHEWRLWNYTNPTDYMKRANAGSTAGGGATLFPNPTPEDDMYDDAAKAEAAARHATAMLELERLRPIKLYALVNEQGAGGWIWVGPSGAWWIVPGGAYAELVAAQGLSQRSPIRAMQQDEFNFLTKQLLPITNPIAQQVEAELDRIVALDEGTVASIVKGISDTERPVALTPDQLAAVTSAALKGAEQGGEQGAKAAIAGLSFVVETV